MQISFQMVDSHSLRCSHGHTQNIHRFLPLPHFLHLPRHQQAMNHVLAKSHRSRLSCSNACRSGYVDGLGPISKAFTMAQASDSHRTALA